MINYVYEYPLSDLYAYSIIVIKEMQKRNYKINNFSNMKKYFGFEINLDYNINIMPFANHHNNKYLKQCFYNLEEKYDRGQKDLTKENYDNLRKIVFELLNKD